MHPNQWVEQMNHLIASFVDGKVVQISVGDVDLEVQIAASDQSRAEGLASTESVPHDGMLFVYDGTSTAAYTRTDMSYDIDIRFYDYAGQLLLASTDSSQVEVRPAAPYNYVLETAPRADLEGSLKIQSLRPAEPAE